MSTTTKNPIALARAALEAGEKAFKPYSHPKSPHKFTQPQLFALLVLRQFFRLDYRGVIEWVGEWPKLQCVLGITNLPHYSTLCYAERRLLKKNGSSRLLDATIAIARQRRLIKPSHRKAAIDSTGLESRHVSVYYTRRCGRHKGHYKHRFALLKSCRGAIHRARRAALSPGFGANERARRDKTRRGTQFSTGQDATARNSTNAFPGKPTASAGR